MAGGRGARALGAIAKGAVLVAVPAGSCVSADGCLGETTLVCDEVRQFLGSRSPPLSGFSALALALCHEAALGEASGCAAYVRALPAEVDSPLLWSDEERALVAAHTSVGLALDAVVGAERAIFERTIAKVLRAGSSEALFPGVDVEGGGFEAWARAAAAVSSRAFNMDRAGGDDGDGDDGDGNGGASIAPYLIPGVDMLNHSPHPARRCTRLRYSREGVAGIEGGAFFLCADRDVTAGEEVRFWLARSLRAHLLRLSSLFPPPLSFSLVRLPPFVAFFSPMSHRILQRPCALTRSWCSSSTRMATA